MDFDTAVAELETLVGTLERDGDERALHLLDSAAMAHVDDDLTAAQRSNLNVRDQWLALQVGTDQQPILQGRCQGANAKAAGSGVLDCIGALPSSLQSLNNSDHTTLEEGFGCLILGLCQRCRKRRPQGLAIALHRDGKTGTAIPGIAADLSLGHHRTDAVIVGREI